LFKTFVGYIPLYGFLDAFVDADDGFVAKNDPSFFDVMELRGGGIDDFFRGEEESFVEESGEELGDLSEEEGEEGGDDDGKAGLGVYLEGFGERGVCRIFVPDGPCEVPEEDGLAARDEEGLTGDAELVVGIIDLGRDRGPLVPAVPLGRHGPIHQRLAPLDPARRIVQRWFPFFT